MKKTSVAGWALAVALTALPAVGLAAEAKAPGGAGGVYVSPPRYQIFEAPRPYGGLIMLDTQTGDSFQRVIVNTQQGIEIRWIRLDRQKGVQPNETILWE
ncbi:MAG: hypothetical protein ACOZHQ_18060 [Thermodesulfobacteriota bacterium]